LLDEALDQPGVEPVGLGQAGDGRAKARIWTE
jgi:hypothetical protein